VRPVDLRRARTALRASASAARAQAHAADLERQQRERAMAARRRRDGLRRMASFNGATAGGRLYGDWTPAILSPYQEVRYNLRTLRARARDLVKNNDYAKGFIREFRSQVVGPDGILLQAKIKNQAGRLRRDVNYTIEASWQEWGEPTHASADGRLSWVDTQGLIAETLATDGEVFLRKVGGFQNKFGFTTHLLDADLLDEGFEAAPDSSGVEIKMGVEMDRWGRPVAYHFWRRHPNDPFHVRGDRERIPAEEIEHIYLPFRSGVPRGVTWFSSTMLSMHTLGAYTEAELVAAREGASKMGFIEWEKGEDYEPPTPEEMEEEGLDMVTEPGVVHELAPGQKYVSHSPDHPNQAFPTFVQMILSGAARGLGASYASFSGDYSNASYSSQRASLLPERDQWRALQRWLVVKVCRPVYRDWIRYALLYSALRLDSRLASDYSDVQWNPRGWKWVDPSSDLDAVEKMIALGITSRARVCAEMGADFEDVLSELAEEDRLARELGLVITPGQIVPQQQPSADRENEGPSGEGASRPPSRAQHLRVVAADSRAAENAFRTRAY
jgi:lambda family phage portal protein